MAQIGYTPIKLYYSTTAAATPLAADLALGELALNANDGKLYYKNSVTNLVTQVAGGGATYTLNGVAYADTTTSLAANGNLTYNGTTLTAANNISVSGMTVGAGSVGNITNSYIGYQTGTTVSGTNNTAYGYRALRFSTSSRSTAVGTEALATSTGSNDSVAIGYRAVYTATGNSGHCGVGSNALLVATGAYNTALGFNAGSQITTGSGNLVLGTMTSTVANSPAKVLTTQNDEISIGTTSTTAATIQVAWTVLSDARDKINVTAVPHGLDFVKNLNPVQYQLTETRGDTKPHGPVRYGFLAQEVLALEGETPVIINNEDPEKLRYTDSYLLPVLVQAIKELKAEFDAYKAAHP